MKIDIPFLDKSLCCKAKLYTNTKPMLKNWNGGEGYTSEQIYRCSQCYKRHSVDVWYSFYTPSGD